MYLISSALSEILVARSNSRNVSYFITNFLKLVIYIFSCDRTMSELADDDGDGDVCEYLQPHYKLQDFL